MATLLGAEGVEAGLSSDMHPRIDGIPANYISSSDLGNHTACPCFLDDGEFDFWCGMIFSRRDSNKIIKSEFVKGKVSDN